MKVWIDVDERYPDHSVSTQKTWSGVAVFVHRKTYERWVATRAAYEQVQREMSRAESRGISERRRKA